MDAAHAKTQRMRDALAHREGDRVPAGEFFWTGFLQRCRAKWGPDFDPYRHFDLDYVVVTPNMDPRIRPFEILKQDEDEVILKTGFGATIRRRSNCPMPSFEQFSVNAPEAMGDFAFDDPADPRRFHEGGDDQINCVGDALARDIPSWERRLMSYVSDFAVFGSVCEPYEYLWRCIGSENALLWIAAEPEAFEAFVHRIGRFLLDFARAQIAAAKGRFAGMYVWGDVACRRGMLFNPETWRRLFKPHVADLIRLCHAHDLPVIYHGCGDSRMIFDDLIELKLDGYNPLEAKAGLDVVELKRQYSRKLAFCGNIDVRVLETGEADAICREVRYKLRAARGGGYIFQSDHSITTSVSPESYELAIRTLRESREFPLKGL